jgi:hypothetical protein
MRVIIQFCCVVALLAALIGTSGCRALRDFGGLAEQPIPLDQNQVSNPLAVTLVDRWQVMEQVSDELDDYFRILRDERIAVYDGIMSEGRIETHPRIGGTLLEPWRKDSLLGFERLHATLQTVRRFAKVRVVPAGDRYQIDLKVYKELEDLPQPMGSGVSGQILRHDSTLDIDREGLSISSPNQGWIPMGRDVLLEQQILRNIQARLQRCVNGPQQ